MKNALYIFLIAGLALTSCKNRKQQKEVVTEIPQEINKESEDLSELPPKEVSYLNEEELGIKVLISLSKTVCFGKCPAYNFSVFANNRALYEGIKDVERIGKFEAQVTKKDIEILMIKASKIGFFSLKNTYDNKYVTDLPTALTYLDYNGKEKKVICRFECDVKIDKVNALLEEFIESITWKEID